MREANRDDALDAHPCIPYSEVMEVRFSPDMEAKIARVAAEAHSDAAEYIRQLVEQYFEHDEWFRRKVSASLERLDRGEFLSHEEAGARIAEMFRR